MGAVFYSYEFLLRILPSVMTSDLMQAHHLTTAGFGYLAATYYVIYTLMQLPVGLLIDRYGPRRLLLFASGICAMGSFLFASSSLTFAVIGRILIGLGSAFGFVGVLRLASLCLPLQRFALATGLVTTLGMIGGVIGDLGLSHLVEITNWHIAILSSAWMGVLLMMMFYCMPEIRHHWIHQREQQPRHLSEQIKTILRMPVIWLNGFVGSLLYIPLSVFGELWGISYLETVQELTRLEATLAVSWLMWGWAVGAPLAGWLADKMGRRYRVLLSGSFLSCLLILFVLQTHFSSHITLFFAMFLFGVFCSGQVLAMVIVRDICPSPLLGTGLAITNMIIMASSFIAQPLIGILMRSHSFALTHHFYYASVSVDYRHAMYVVPASIFLGIVILVVQIRWVRVRS